MYPKDSDHYKQMEKQRGVERQRKLYENQKKYEELRRNVINYYIPKELADRLDVILKAEADKQGFKSRNDLILRILSHFTSMYFYREDIFIQALDRTVIGEMNELNRDKMTKALARASLNKLKEERKKSNVTFIRRVDSSSKT